MNPDKSKWISSEYVLHSRTYEMNIKYQDARLFIKREDELSSGITGSKYRKYASLIPFLRREEFDEILLIGSAQSNHVAGALQLLIENGIKARLMLLESNEAEPNGNFLWITLLYDMNEIIWINRRNWPQVNERAEQYRSAQKKKGKNVFIVNEGGAVVQAIHGAMSLAEDICVNENELNLAFDHFCIDSGSGTSAIGLIFGLQNRDEKRNIHITLIAGTENDFRLKYEKLAVDFESFSGMKTEKQIPARVFFYPAVIAPSFGSINSEVLTGVKNIARNHGILMDPVYSVKHFLSVRNLLEQKQINGNVLFIYNGGSLGLSGFQKKLT